MLVIPVSAHKSHLFLRECKKRRNQLLPLERKYEVCLSSSDSEIGIADELSGQTGELPPRENTGAIYRNELGLASLAVAGPDFKL